MSGKLEVGSGKFRVLRTAIIKLLKEKIFLS